MKLELCRFKVRDAVFGASTGLKQGKLYINKEELIGFINRDSLFESVDVEIARPGEPVRVVHVMDAVEPRLKAAGGDSAFPGVLGRMEIAGSGRTNVLDGVAVLQTGQRQGIQEGIVDMSGPGAGFSIFSRTVNVVLLC
ncbi:MAG: glycine/sarcosine/betaine reductase component B subunit, partial [Eubacteriales bacterium]